MKEYFRPCKLLSMLWLLNGLWYGSKVDHLHDWEVGVSASILIMAYLTAPWVVRVFLELKWRLVPLAIIAVWVSINGVYWAWNIHYGALMDDAFRSANWLVLLRAYLIFGFLWLYRGSLRELWSEIKVRVRSLHTWRR
jgi:hypothetical protein